MTQWYVTRFEVDDFVQVLRGLHFSGSRITAGPHAMQEELGTISVNHVASLLRIKHRAVAV